ncbi:unannotated protein [freshwater metagenome]|uniref:Unannotated protein n=1 Tax=freshwater metagenome TaxID=449393 RepID=A0A6J7K4P2_9ZZZZ|nr:hypothetical protein [Actinomycetota bacterium]
MSLDRQSIEKRDFPISRRGYETVAVDEHLARLAAEIEALQAATPAPEVATSLASSASERIRGIVEAAEATAAEIERTAGEEAAAVRASAAADAAATREAASSEAQAHVAAVQEATSTMLDRIGALEQTVSGLLTNVRSSAGGIGADLATLHAQVVEVGGLGSGASTRETAGVLGEPAPVASSGPVAPAEPVTAPPVAAPLPSEPVAEPAPQPAGSTPEDAVGAPETLDGELVGTTEPVAPELPLSGVPAQRSTDVAGARMVALNLVLDGVPRDEIEAHLQERYALEDQASLLDELYAKQGG